MDDIPSVTRFTTQILNLLYLEDGWSTNLRSLLHEGTKDSSEMKSLELPPLNGRSSIDRGHLLPVTDPSKKSTVLKDRYILIL